MTFRWRKSSRSSGGNSQTCVEIAHTRDRLRDSKNPGGPELTGDVDALVGAIRRGRLTR